MDAFKAQFQRIQQQLSALSASQKMLVMSLVAIMVMTMLWWARYAGTSELEPLLNQPMSESDIAQITHALSARNIEARVVGGKILVPAQRRMEALAHITYAQLLPSDTRSGFDEMISRISPWQPQSQSEAMFNRGKEMTLSNIIRGWPNVRMAAVMIDPTRERRIGATVQPTASINIQTRGVDNRERHRLAESAARFVASAQAGLTPDNVTVVIDGRTERVRKPGGNDYASGELYEQIEALERRYTEKIMQVVGYTGNALVTVSVEVETQSSEETRRIFDRIQQKERTIETDASESIQPQLAASEPGAASNMGLEVPVVSASPAASSTSEKNRTELENFADVSEQHIVRPGGRPTVTAAAVRIPKSFFVHRWRERNPGAGDPTPEALQPMIDAEVAHIGQLVAAATNIWVPDRISVGTYYDGIPTLSSPGMASAGGAGEGTVGLLLGSNVKEIAIGLLALISLFMASMIVKKGAPQPTIVEPPEPREPPRLQSGEEVAGEVGGAASLLDGMELDEDALQAQQMVEQVQNMVKDNPDAAANLVKRWLNQA